MVILCVTEDLEIDTPNNLDASLLTRKPFLIDEFFEVLGIKSFLTLLANTSIIEFLFVYIHLIPIIVDRLGIEPI